VARKVVAARRLPSSCGRDDQPACADRAWTASAQAARAIKSGEARLMIAGGVESMSRALR